MVHQVTRNLVINTTTDAIWAVLANLETIQHYDSGVLKASYVTSERSGVGAARVCVLPNNETMHERIIQWEEGKSYTIEVYEDHTEGWTCEDQIASFQLTELSAEQTLVTMEYQYQIKPNVLSTEEEVGQMAEELVSGVLSGLKDFIERGEAVQMNH